MRDQRKAKCCSREEGKVAWSYLKKRLGELNLVGGQGPFSDKAIAWVAKAYRRRLAGKHLVPFLHRRCSGSHYPAPPDWRRTGRGIPAAFARGRLVFVDLVVG